MKRHWRYIQNFVGVEKSECISIASMSLCDESKDSDDLGKRRARRHGRSVYVATLYSFAHSVRRNGGGLRRCVFYDGSSLASMIVAPPVSFGGFVNRWV